MGAVPWIGLTGGIACGKSTVSRMLRDKGLDVVDADQLAREVVQNGTPGHREVVLLFGADAVSDDGELDRKKIGRLVFADRSKLEALEKIIHPRVRELAALKRAELAQKGRVGFYDVPLLFEKHMRPMFDKVVVVACPKALQLERLAARDGVASDEAARRIASQLPIESKVALADVVIRNEGSLQELQREVDRALASLGVHQAQT